MEATLVFALTIVFVILLVHCYCEFCLEHANVLLWETRDTYIMLVKKYGLPTALNPEEGGGAVWNLDQMQLMLFDQKYGIEPEPTIHLCIPIKLFASVNSNTVKTSEHGRQKRVADILNILPQYMSYDPVKEQVMARFYSLQIAQVLIMLAMKITTGEITLDNIQNDDLIMKYSQRVTRGSIEYQPSVVTKVESYINNYISCFC